MIRRPFRLAIITAAAFFGASCDYTANYRQTTKTTGFTVEVCDSCSSVFINVWTDPDTGCESYVTGDGFVSPRLGPDGMQRCSSPTEQPIQAVAQP